MNIHDALPTDGRHTALLSIDLQMYDIDPGSGLLAESTPEDTAGYLRHMQETVIPNVAQLQAAFRAARFEVLHARLQSMTQMGETARRGTNHSAFMSRQAAPRLSSSPR